MEVENISFLIVQLLSLRPGKSEQKSLQVREGFLKKHKNRYLVVPVLQHYATGPCCELLSKRRKFIRIETVFRKKVVKCWDSPNGIYLSEWVGSFTQEAIRTCRSSFYLIRHTKAFLSLLFLLISTFHRFGSVDHHSCQPSRWRQPS